MTEPLGVSRGSPLVTMGAGCHPAGAEGGTRTPILLLGPAPEAGASTNFATSAQVRHHFVAAVGCRQIKCKALTKGVKFFGWES